MDNETATLIAWEAQRWASEGYRVLSVTIVPNYNGGSDGDLIVFDVDDAVQDAGAA